MATDGTYKIASLPEGSDLVARGPYNGELVKMDAGLAHMLALQTGSSTTAYTTDAPFSAYYTGLTIQFMALYSNSAACTLNVNGLGAKKLCAPAGSQISAANGIRALQLYALIYDEALDSANGGFRVYQNYMDLVSAQTIAGAKTLSDALTANGLITANAGLTANDPIQALDSVSPIITPKGLWTPEGGFAVKLTNKTGAPSVRGLGVMLSTVYDSAVVEYPHGGGRAMGTFYEDGVADGSEAWVVTDGIGPFRMQSGLSAVRGQYGSDSTSVDGKFRNVSYSDVYGYCQWLENSAAGGVALGLWFKSRDLM